MPLAKIYFQPFGTDVELDATLSGLRADTQIAHALGARDLLILGGTRSKWNHGDRLAGWNTNCPGLQNS
jgi:hypothetical protein